MNTPFIDFKATEISPEKQKCFFVEPKHIKRVISPKASMIIGERGSGKTTLLRHLEKSFNHSETLDSRHDADPSPRLLSDTESFRFQYNSPHWVLQSQSLNNL